MQAILPARQWSLKRNSTGRTAVIADRIVCLTQMRLPYGSIKSILSKDEF
jgi:hypothetical protein